MEHLKSWWVLPASLRYPPPTLPSDEDDGVGQASGAICPGHFIPTKKKYWNKIINRKGPLEYPMDMQLLHGEQWGMVWHVDEGRDAEFAVKARAPATLVAGVSANVEASAAFKTSVSKYWAFDRLDTYMVQPLYTYIEDSLEDDDIKDYIKKNTSTLLGKWEIYMISGIIVAKGAKMNTAHTQDSALKAHGGGGAHGIAEAALGASWSSGHEDSTQVERMSDFVWAIQLARIHKDGHGRDWDWETLWDDKTSGSTFTLDNKAEARSQFERAMAASDEEAVQKAAVFGLERGDQVFVVLAEVADANSQTEGPQN